MVISVSLTVLDQPQLFLNGKCDWYKRIKIFYWGKSWKVGLKIWYKTKKWIIWTSVGLSRKNKHWIENKRNLKENRVKFWSSTERTIHWFYLTLTHV